MSYQQVIIVGNLGADAEFSYTPTGFAVCKFSVAVSKKRGKGEDRQEETTWFRCSVWRERAEAIHSWLHKGSKVMVVGEVKANAYTDKNTGKAAASLELTANQVVFLDSKSDNSDRPAAPTRSARAPQGGAEPDDDPSLDIPF